MREPALDRWLARSRVDAGARIRLFCFPYAGGGAMSTFHPWGMSLPTGVEVCPVQLPGREDRLAEIPFRHTESLSAAILAALRPHLDRPYALFGHSMGSLIAFELARALRRDGLPEPEWLFVSGRGAPSTPHPFPRISHLEDGGLAEWLRRVGGTSEQALRNPELMRCVLPAFRADIALCENYRYDPGAPLKCPITVFGGRDDEYAPMPLLAAWRVHTYGDFDVQLLPGAHLFLNTERPALLKLLARRLQSWLDASSLRESGACEGQTGGP